MAGLEAVLEDQVERVLDARQRLGGIVILVVDVDIVIGDGIADIVRQKDLIHIAFGRLGSKFHHHAGRGVGVHVGILAGDVVDLRVDDGLEDLGTLGLAGEVALVAVGDVFPRHFLAGGLHQFHFHAVLDFLDAHFLFVELGDRVGDLRRQDDVLSGLCHIHRFEDGRDDFLVVEIHMTAVSLEYLSYHFFK